MNYNVKDDFNDLSIQMEKIKRSIKIAKDTSLKRRKKKRY